MIAALMSSVTASAAVFNYDVKASSGFFHTSVVQPGESLELNFTVLDDIVVTLFAIGTTGKGATTLIAENDVRAIRFGFGRPAVFSFNQPTTLISASVIPVVSPTLGPLALGNATMPGGTYLAGTMFSFFLDGGIQNDVILRMAFYASPLPLPHVPLPAAGLLLGPVVLAGGYAAVRKRRAAAPDA